MANEHHARLEQNHAEGIRAEAQGGNEAADDSRRGERAGGAGDTEPGSNERGT